MKPNSDSRMRRFSRFRAFVAALAIIGFGSGFFANRASAQTNQLVIYFDFNDSAPAPGATPVPNGSPAPPSIYQSDLTASPPPSQTTTLTTNFSATDVQVAAGTALVNLAPGDPTGAGQSLQLAAGSFANGANGNNGDYIQFSANTTGLQNLSLSYASRSTSKGFTSQALSYSLDGVNFSSAVTTVSPGNDSTFTKVFIDLKDLTAVNDQSVVYFRLTFSGAINANGNTDLDNIQLNGMKQAPEPATWMSAALAAGAVLLARRGQPMRPGRRIVL